MNKLKMCLMFIGMAILFSLAIISDGGNITNKTLFINGIIAIVLMIIPTI